MSRRVIWLSLGYVALAGLTLGWPLIKWIRLEEACQRVPSILTQPVQEQRPDVRGFVAAVKGAHFHVSEQFRGCSVTFFQSEYCQKMAVLSDFLTRFFVQIQSLEWKGGDTGECVLTIKW